MFKKIHNEAPPLSEAFYCLYGKEIRERYEHLTAVISPLSRLTAGVALLESPEHQEQKVKELGEAGLFEPPRTPGEYVDKFITLIREIPNAPSLNEVKDHAILDKNLKDCCLNDLKSGLLIAFGYAVPRHPEDSPLRVPLEAFSGNIHWDTNVIKLGSMKVEQVRVVHINWLEEFNLAGPAPQKAKAGRKTKRSDILQAYDELMAVGVLQGEESIKVTGEKVRTRVMKNTGCSEKGLSNQTIYEQLKQK